MTRMALALALATSLVASSGCATIMSGGQSRLQVDVEGPDSGVTTTVKGVYNEDEVTRQDRHFDVVLDRQSSYVVVASAAGYKHEIKVVKMEINHWIWGNYGFMAAGLAMTFLAPMLEQRRETPTGQIISGSPATEWMSASMMAVLAGLLVDAFMKNGTKHDTNAVELHLEKQE